MLEVLGTAVLRCPGNEDNKHDCLLPEIFDPSGFFTEKSLMVFKYGILMLHTLEFLIY